jgi:hypothetical protein
MNTYKNCQVSVEIVRLVALVVDSLRLNSGNVIAFGVLLE